VRLVAITHDTEQPMATITNSGRIFFITIPYVALTLASVARDGSEAVILLAKTDDQFCRVCSLDIL
jgi:hypothetical protein